MVRATENTSNTSMSQLSRRFDDLSARFDQNDKKLDVLIDLTKHMAVLQEKQIHLADEMHRFEQKEINKELDLRNSFKTIEERIVRVEVEAEKSLKRVHDRLDVQHSALEQHIKDGNDKHQQNADKIDTKFDAIKGDIKKLSDDYKGRVSFFKGVFFAFAILSAVIQAGLYKYFNDFTNAVNDEKVAVQKVQGQIQEQEKQIDMVIRNQRGQK